MLKYLEKNVNPRKRKTTDCVVRALTVASGKDYKDVFKDLFEISLETGYFVNEKRTEDKVLEKYGFIKMKQPRKYDGTKYQIGELDKLVKSGTVVIRCAHHLTVAVDGVLIDTWDCRTKTINNYYIKESK